MLASCNWLSTPFSLPSQQPADLSPATAVPGSPTALPNSDLAITPEPSPAVTSPLVWWTPADHAPAPLVDSPAAQWLADQLNAFRQLTDGREVQVVLKKPFGKGGILDFLRTASAAAPSILPDLVTIHSDELAVATRYGLLQPLDPFITPEFQNDLFPFARQAGQVEGTLYGLQWDADLVHVVYDTRLLPSPPETWEELLAAQVKFAIPGSLAEGPVNDSFLILYAGAGGMDPQADSPVDAAALHRVLDFLAMGREKNIFLDSTLALADPAACWAALMRGAAQMAQVSASHYLSVREEAPWAGYAAMPTWDGRAVTIGRGWMLAIVAREPERQAAAARLIAWLLRPEHAGEWTMAGHRLPATRAALAHWGNADPYIAFIRQLLEAALPRPGDEKFAAASRALQWAERQVLSGNLTPEQAVSDVLAEVNR